MEGCECRGADGAASHEAGRGSQGRGGPQGWLTKAAEPREQLKQRGTRWMTAVEGNSGSSWRKD